VRRPSPGNFQGFPKSLSRFRAFCGALCGGLVETSADARGCYQAGKSSSFQRQKADAHGSGHFFAPTYADVTALSSHCSPGGTIILRFPGSYSPTIVLNTERRVIAGIACAANISFREESFEGPRLSCSCGIPGIVSSLCIYK
jgi:hypothetical protein